MGNACCQEQQVGVAEPSEQDTAQLVQTSSPNETLFQSRTNGDEAAGGEGSSLTELPPAVLKCKRSLQRLFRGNARFKPLPQPHIKPMHVSDLFVECQVAEPNYSERYCRSSEAARSPEALGLKLGKPVAGEKVEIRDLFKPRQSQGQGREYPIKTAGLTGPPGCGKTLTSTIKLPFEWAEGKWLSNTALLFVIKIRDIRNQLWEGEGEDKVASTKMSLADLLGLHKLGLEDDEVYDVLEFLRRNFDSEKVLIVVDGKFLSVYFFCMGAVLGVR